MAGLLRLILAAAGIAHSIAAAAQDSPLPRIVNPCLLQLLAPDPNSNGPSPFGDPCAPGSPPAILPPALPVSRNVDGILDNRPSRLVSADLTPVTAPEAPSRVVAVRNNRGKDIRRFTYGEDGMLREARLPNGSYRPVENGKWRFNANDGSWGIPELERMTVDGSGNLSFYNGGIGADVTITTTEYTIIAFRHRLRWQARATAMRAEFTAEGNLARVVDGDGQLLREFVYAAGTLIGVRNPDDTRWDSTDGGKTWIFHEADGEETPYPELDLKVDRAGNVGYTIAGRPTVEFIDGVNMIGPPADWVSRWIAD